MIRLLTGVKGCRKHLPGARTQECNGLCAVLRRECDFPCSLIVPVEMHLTMSQDAVLLSRTHLIVLPHPSAGVAVCQAADGSIHNAALLERRPWPRYTPAVSRCCRASAHGVLSTW